MRQKQKTASLAPIRVLSLLRSELETTKDGQSRSFILSLIEKCKSDMEDLMAEKKYSLIKRLDILKVFLGVHYPDVKLSLYPRKKGAMIVLTKDIRGLKTIELPKTILDDIESILSRNNRYGSEHRKVEDINIEIRNRETMRTTIKVRNKYEDDDDETEEDDED